MKRTWFFNILLHDTEENYTPKRFSNNHDCYGRFNHTGDNFYPHGPKPCREVTKLRWRCRWCQFYPGSGEFTSYIQHNYPKCKRVTSSSDTRQNCDCVAPKPLRGKCQGCFHSEKKEEVGEKLSQCQKSLSQEKDLKRFQYFTRTQERCYISQLSTSTQNKSTTLCVVRSNQTCKDIHALFNLFKQFPDAIVWCHLGQYTTIPPSCLRSRIWARHLIPSKPDGPWTTYINSAKG